MSSFLGSVLVRLAVAAPLTRFCIKRDKAWRNKSILKRIFLHAAILTVILTFSYPFFSREPNFFEHFNATVKADKSTVYQQYRRAQTWLDEQVGKGEMTPEEAGLQKAENERKHSYIHDSGRKFVYIKFGDIIDFSSDNYEEPSFLYAATFAATYTLWIMSAVLLLCYYLPPGALLAIFLGLCVLFCVEIECRFIESDSLFNYVFFVDSNEWTVFEVIRALKESVVSFVCLVITLAGLFSENDGGETKSHVRNLLRTNAALITLLKDENLKEAQIEPDEPIGSKTAKFADFVARGIGLVILVFFLFFKS